MFWGTFYLRIYSSRNAITVNFSPWVGEPSEITIETFLTVREEIFHVERKSEFGQPVSELGATGWAKTGRPGQLGGSGESPHPKYRAGARSGYGRENTRED